MSSRRGSRRAAIQAGLRHVSDGESGIRRVRRGRGFTYVRASGRTVRDAATIDRIEALAIPPAWQDVWICADARGHLQATGRDARGRKQYRYHADWRTTRDDSKYARLSEFAEVLPRLRARVDRDLSRSDMSRERVLATVVRLLERTLMRVGNDEYARTNQSFGLTTIRDRHVQVDGDTMRFRFKGKSGKVHEIEARDPRAARVVKRCRRLPGQELFGYRDDDGVDRDVGSADVNAYLHEATGGDFTAKDFRTWAGTVVAAVALSGFEPPESDREASRTINEAIDQVAAALGNTRAIARNSYVHPAVVDAYRDGTLAAAFDRRVRRVRGLTRPETVVARLIAGAAATRAKRSA